jgi:glycerophosphoryl diester phosphodiesterase
LKELFRFTGAALPLVSAHRGGPSENFPENCLATFEDTLRDAYAILEIDPRLTRDGQIVVHHDATLERTTTGSGLLANHTLAEVRALRLKDPLGNITNYQVPTLDETLEWARNKTILVLDQKDVSVAQRVQKIEEHKAESFAVLIVYSFEAAKECYALNKDIMMEVMIPNTEKFEEFSQTGIPWSNVIAFIGHAPPNDKQLVQLLHSSGTCAMAGSSRNLDRELLHGSPAKGPDTELGYHNLLEFGVDIIETDLPRQVANILYGSSQHVDTEVLGAKSTFFSFSR